MKTLEITTVVTISEQTVKDLLACAFEGGSNYWYSDVNSLAETSEERFYDNLINNGFSLLDSYNEDNVVIKVHPSAFQLALSQMSVEFKTHFDEIVSGNFDAGTGDVFLQLCCFGKVIYG